MGNCLIRILINHEEADPLLERYAQVRRLAWINYTNTASIEFKLRLHSTQSEIEARRDSFFDALNNDPSIHIKMATMMNEAVEDMFEDLSHSDNQMIRAESQGAENVAPLVNPQPVKT